MKKLLTLLCSVCIIICICSCSNNVEQTNLNTVVTENTTEEQLIDNTENTTSDINYIVDATLENPAKLGEWVSTVAFNKNINQYEPICICITDIITGNNALNYIQNYNNIHNTQYIIDNEQQEFVIYKYSVYFPTSFTTDNGYINNVYIPINLCNTLDNNTGINGDTQLANTITDISDPINTPNGVIWTNGIGFYKMNIGFTNYFIKLDVDNKDIAEPKYFTLIR